jgi:hypothetical protein
MSNETHWVKISAVDGYKIPITADDADSLVQRENHPFASSFALSQVATQTKTTIGYAMYEVMMDFPSTFITMMSTTTVPYLVV